MIMILVFGSCQVQKQIIDKPIVFDDERVEMTKDYLRNRYQLVQETPEIVPKMVVLHWTGLGTLEDSFDAFYDVKAPNWRQYIGGVSGLNVSTQFLVDRDGTIYRLMPENYMGRHVIGLNHCSIGIENVGGTDEWPLTKEQLKSNIWLVKYLAKKYDMDYLIGHYEYTNFEGHPLWLEVDDGYRTEKTDPGIDFMKKVRKATKRFNFKPVPSK